jgi:hypothetical protein
LKKTLFQGGILGEERRRNNQFSRLDVGKRVVSAAPHRRHALRKSRKLRNAFGAKVLDVLDFVVGHEGGNAPVRNGKPRIVYLNHVALHHPAPPLIASGAVTIIEVLRTSAPVQVSPQSGQFPSG